MLRVPESIMTKKIIAGFILITVVFGAAGGALMLSPQDTYATSHEKAAKPAEKKDTSALCNPIPGLNALFGGTSRGNIGGCVVLIFYYLFVGVTSPFVFLGGQAFDYSVALSLSSKVLGGEDPSKSTIQTGWRTVRDVANMVFIFLLIYIAIATILSLEGFHTFQLLRNLIIVALLINFSLFAARVVIDASNLLALSFYSRMTSQNATVEQPTVLGIVLPKNLSTSVMQAIGTHRIIGDNDTFDKFSNAYEKFGAGKDIFFGAALFVLLGIVNIVLAFVLFAAAFLFVGRIIALWLLMIFAPIGFIAFILPQTSTWAKKWWAMLFSQAFFAPVFIFLFYLLLLFLVPQSGSGETFVMRLVGQLQNVNDKNIDAFWLALAAFIINFAIVITFLIAILMIAKSMSGKGGSVLVRGAGASGRWIAGFSGRNTFGRFAHLMSSPETGIGKGLQKLSLRSPTLGRVLYGGLKATAGFGFGQKGSKGFAGGVKAQREFTKEHVGFALTGLEGKERDKAEQRMLLKAVAPGAALTTSTGAKEIAAERLRVLEKRDKEMRIDLEGAADRFNKTIDMLADELELGGLLHRDAEGDDRGKFDASRMRAMNRDDLQRLAKKIGDRIDRHENRYAPQLEGRRIEADRTRDFGRMTELLALEKANSKTTAAMKELRGEIKKLIATEEKKE